MACGQEQGRSDATTKKHPYPYSQGTGASNTGSEGTWVTSTQFWLTWGSGFKYRLSREFCGGIWVSWYLHPLCPSLVPIKQVAPQGASP